MRTHNPTYANYSGDGTGRDSYIILNNGGLTREPKSHMMWSTRGMKSPRDLRAMPGKPAVAFQYHSDGTGRDSYVVSNSGGLVSDFRGSKADNFFTGTLRQHGELSPGRAAALMNATDYTSNFRTPKEKALIQAQATFQKHQVDRLSPERVRRFKSLNPSEIHSQIGRVNNPNRGRNVPQGLHATEVKLKSGFYYGMNN